MSEQVGPGENMYCTADCLRQSELTPLPGLGKTKTERF